MALIRSCTIRLDSQDGIYQRIVIDDMMKNIVYDSGQIEVDLIMAIFFCKANFHIITIDKSVDKFVEENEQFYFCPTKYGEFVLRRDCAKEVA